MMCQDSVTLAVVALGSFDSVKCQMGHLRPILIAQPFLAQSHCIIQSLLCVRVRVSAGHQA